MLPVHGLGSLLLLLSDIEGMMRMLRKGRRAFGGGGRRRRREMKIAGRRRDDGGHEARGINMLRTRTLYM